MQLVQSLPKGRIGLSCLLVREGSLVFDASQFGTEGGEGRIDFGADVGVEFLGQEVAGFEVEDDDGELDTLIEFDLTLLI